MNRRIRVKTQPASEPISLKEAKKHLNIEDDFTEDDVYITSLITVAREYAEGFQKKSICGYTLELLQDSFTDPIILEKGPVQSVTSVKFTRADGSQVVIAPSDYILSSDGRLYAKSYWPMDTLMKVDGVRVEYVTGENPIPLATKQAILLLISNWYENREPMTKGVTSKVPFSVQALLYMGKEW